MVKVKKVSAGQSERYQERMLAATELERGQLKAEFDLANYNLKGTERVDPSQLKIAMIGGALAERWGIKGEFTRDLSERMINHDRGLTLDGQTTLIPPKIEYEKNYFYTDEHGVDQRVHKDSYDRVKHHLKMIVSRPDAAGEMKRVYLQVDSSKIVKVGDEIHYHQEATQKKEAFTHVLTLGEYSKFQSHLSKQVLKIERPFLRDGKSGMEKVAFQFEPKNFSTGDVTDGDGNKVAIDKSIPAIEILFSLPKSLSAQAALAQQHDPAMYCRMVNAFSESVSKVMDTEARDNSYSQAGEKLETVYESFIHTDSRSLQPSVHAHVKLSTHGLTAQGESKRLDLDRFGMNDRALENWTHYDSLIMTETVNRWKQLGINFQCENRDRDIETNRFDSTISKIDVDFGKPEILKTINAEMSDSRKELMAEVSKRRDKIASERDKSFNALEAKRSLLSADDYKKASLEIYSTADRKWDFLDSSEGIDLVHQETKARKQDVSSGDLKEAFKGVLDSAGITGEHYQGAINPSGQGAIKNSLINVSADELERRVIKKLTENKIAFTEKELMGAIASQCVGLSIDECRAKTQEIIRNPNYLLQVSYRDDQRNLRQPTQLYTSSMLAEESQRIDRLCAEMTQAKPGKYAVDQAKVEDFISKTTLKPEQADAIRMFFSGDEQIHLVTGLAGTGKSFMADRLAECAALEGRRVYGSALMGVTAADLASQKGADGKSLIQSDTVAKYLLMREWAKEEGHPQQAVYQKQLNEMRGQYMVMDEASLVGTSNMADFLQLMSELEMKTQIIGDRYQINSVSAGAALSQVFAAVDPAKRNILMDIDRQKHAPAELLNARIISGADKLEELIQAGHTPASVDKLYDAHMRSGQQVDKLFEKLERDDRIQLFETKGAVIAEMVDDFTSSTLPIEQRVCLAGTNDSVDRLNQGIVDELHKQDKKRPSNQQAFSGLEVEIYNPGFEKTYKFQAGERITITKNGDGLKNGQVGKLLGITEDPANKGSYQFQFLRDGELKPVTIASELNASGKMSLEIRHYYASTNTKAQGITKNPFILYEPSQLNNAASIYIPNTRAKTESHHYCVESELEQVKTQMRRSGINDDIKDLRIGVSNPYVQASEQTVVEIKAPVLSEVKYQPVQIKAVAVEIAKSNVHAANDINVLQKAHEVQPAANTKEIPNESTHNQQQASRIPEAIIRRGVRLMSGELSDVDREQGRVKLPLSSELQHLLELDDPAQARSDRMFVQRRGPSQSLEAVAPLAGFGGIAGGIGRVNPTGPALSKVSPTSTPTPTVHAPAKVKDRSREIGGR